MDKRSTKYLERSPRHFEVSPRKPGSIKKRTDFMYMGGHGTFYRFDEKHYDENFLNAKEGDRIDLILFNLNTGQLDEVAFNLIGYEKIGEKHLYITGSIADSVDYFQIKIEYFLPNPLQSFIKVYASAKPDYSFYYS